MNIKSTGYMAAALALSCTITAQATKCPSATDVKVYITKYLNKDHISISKKTESMGYRVYVNEDRNFATSFRSWTGQYGPSEFIIHTNPNNVQSSKKGKRLKKKDVIAYIQNMELYPPLQVYKAEPKTVNFCMYNGNEGSVNQDEIVLTTKNKTF